jgi:hypothetical protein
MRKGPCLIPASQRRRAISIGVAIVAAMIWSGTVLAEEQSIKAFSVWQAEGPIVMTGEHQASFTGIFAGPVYVETDHGPVAAGIMVCPAMVRIDLATGRQSATGQCSFQAEDGSSVFADLTCSGVHLVGCDGPFEITGGTGRFAGVTGGGPAVLRGDFRQIKVESGQPTAGTVHGITYWSELRYNLP